MSSYSSYDGRSVWPPLASSLDSDGVPPPSSPQTTSRDVKARQTMQRRRSPGGGHGTASGSQTPPSSFRPLARHSSMPGKISRPGSRSNNINNRSVESSPRLGDSIRFGSRQGLLQRQDSNPFLRKPLALARSSESLSLLPSQQQQQNQTKGPNASIGAYGSTTSAADSVGSSTGNKDPPSCTSNPHHAPLAPLEQSNAETHIHRHLTLLDLIAVGVCGTLGTGIFVLCPLLISSHAGPSAIICWMISMLPALLSGLCFAELSGQIPAAGSTYAYTYAAMGELPAVVAAGCLCLEYLVSAAAVARGWGDKVVDWI